MENNLVMVKGRKTLDPPKIRSKQKALGGSRFSLMDKLHGILLLTGWSGIRVDSAELCRVSLQHSHKTSKPVQWAVEPVTALRASNPKALNVHISSASQFQRLKIRRSLLL